MKRMEPPSSEGYASAFGEALCDRAAEFAPQISRLQRGAIEADTHEEAIVGGIAELSALHDVAFALE